jgi:hypothetical protein
MIPLTTRMRTYARTNAGNERMTELADAMDKAVADCRDDKPSIKRMVGAVARARMHWCEVTGEPLVNDGTVKAGAALLSVLSQFPRRVR